MRTALKTSIFLALSATLFILSLELRLLAKSRFQAVQTDDDRFYLPPAAWLRFFSCGFNEAMADLIWVKSVLYFGKAVVLKPGERFVMRYIESAVGLDPRFRNIYVPGSIFTLYQNSGKVTRKSVDMSMDDWDRGE